MLQGAVISPALTAIMPQEALLRVRPVLPRSCLSHRHYCMIAQQRLDLSAQPSLSYRLRLANRMVWHIRADEAALPLAEDLCRILKLKPGLPERVTRLVLICRSEAAPGCSRLLPSVPAAAGEHGLPREGWIPEDLGVLRLLSMLKCRTSSARPPALPAGN